MAHAWLLRKTPAFALCPGCEELYLCTLSIKHSASRGEASIYVGTSIHVRDFGPMQPFQLAYDAHTWEALSLSAVKKGLDEHRLVEIQWRDTRPNPVTLSLHLRQPCIVRCHPSSGCMAAKPGHEAQYDHFRQLASTTAIDLIFDLRYLNQNHAVFLQFISCWRSLVGVPAEMYNGPLSRQTDWAVFGPFEEDIPESPPSYAMASSEPSRKGIGSTSPARPPSKRRRVLSPAFHMALARVASSSLVGSPTEKATTTTTSPSPPSSPLHTTPVLQRMVKTTIEAILPDALAQLFAVDSSTSDTTAASSIGTRISTRIADHAGELLQKIYIEKLDKLRTDTLNAAYDSRADADYLLYEQVDNYKMDLAITKEEGITELHDEVENTMGKFTERVEALTNQMHADMREQADELCLEASGRLQEAVAVQEKICLQGIKRRNSIPDQDPAAGRFQRASSLPLGV